MGTPQREEGPTKRRRLDEGHGPMHRSAWKRNSRKSTTKILHSPALIGPEATDSRDGLLSRCHSTPATALRTS
jgi:hypothetical protein